MRAKPAAVAETDRRKCASRTAWSNCRTSDSRAGNTNQQGYSDKDDEHNQNENSNLKFMDKCRLKRKKESLNCDSEECVRNKRGQITEEDETKPDIVNGSMQLRIVIVFNVDINDINGKSDDGDDEQPRQSEWAKIKIRSNNE
jgi:hypothetical protein